MEKQIINILENNKNKITYSKEEFQNQIKTKSRKDRKRLSQALANLAANGDIYYDYKEDRYMLFENSNARKGVIDLDSKNRYFIKSDNLKIIIPDENLKKASYGDLVITTYNTKKHSYEVEKIIKKDENSYVAEIINKDNKLYAYNSKIGIVEIEDNEFNLLEGHRVAIKRHEDKYQIKEIICHKDDANSDILTIAYEQGFTEKYPEAILNEIKNIPSYLDEDTINRELASGRIDLRDKNIVTIDCDTTKDIDDGIYIETNSDGDFILYTVIADVHHYVNDQSPISKRIKEMGTSVYPPGCVIPMLPRELSNGICSLNPNVDRLAICFKQTFTSNGELKNFEIFRSIINSKKKMNYSDVDKILDSETMIEGYEQFHKELLLMQKLSLLIEKKFIDNGLLDFETSELDLQLNEQFEIEKINLKKQGTSAKIIEFLMLITNKNTAEYFNKLGIPLIYRIDEKPNYIKIAEQAKFLEEKGYMSDFLEKYSERFEDIENIYFSNKDIQKLLKKISNIEYPEMFHKRLIQCMARAKFSTHNTGHSPLGMRCYAQFTSPIRRGGDWRNHSILNYYLDTNNTTKTFERFPNNILSKEAETYSIKERRADNTAAIVEKLLLVRYIKNNLEDLKDIPLKGRISNLRGKARVELNNGLYGIININDDICKNKGYDLTYKDITICSLGDLVEVRISDVDLKNNEIIFTLDKVLGKELDINVQEKKKKEKNKKKVKTR